MRGGRGASLLAVLVAACALLPLLAIAPAAVAAPRPPSPGATQAATLAAHLRADPVYVTDQLPRAVPRSTAPDFARLAERTGVPTYVLVLPEGGSGGSGGGGAGDGAGEALLGAVHDRLGRDGLFVLVDDSSVVAAGAYGVRVPAEDARTVQVYELPYDAGALLSFERFVEVVSLGRAKAAERAESAREEYGGHGPYGEGYKDPEPLHIGPADRRNQSFMTGIALAALPLLVLLLVPYVRRWWGRRRPGTGGSGTGSTSGAGWFVPRRPRPRPRRPRAPWLVVPLAAGVAAVIAVTATALFDQSTSSAAPPPTSADMTARVERVADGLRRDPVYSDPESPRPLAARHIAELRSRAAEFGPGPVHFALVPQLSEDESAGVPEAFADALHAELGQPGVYVVADPLSGDIDAVTYDVRIDANLVAFDVPDAIHHAAADDRSDDHRLGERLDKLMTFLEKTPRSDVPETSSYGEPAPDPVEESTLPRLFSGDFWPGLLVGAIGAVLVFGIVAGALGTPGTLRRAARFLRFGGSAGSGASGASGTSGASGASGPAAAGSAFTAPPAPSTAYLRDTARAELHALAAEFDPDAALPSPLRNRVWDCLDTATLLADRGGSGNDGSGHNGSGRNGRGPDGRLDDEAPPADLAVDLAADLAAAITLARIGRAALASGDITKPCCALNPLHGPATGWRDAQYAPEDSRRRTLPVCASCRLFVTENPGRAHTLRLTLPAPAVGRGAARVLYEDAPGPLPAARTGVPQLIRKVREYAGVQ
ncbi:hypothetical protein ABZ953_33670 [Streptomyces sp. NPDC046465]|uniref:hypothetical protein n=1 Tax=Streptomyces sp. NPDC046465 TaxID=3155810 RepID=UPI0033E2FE53